MDSLQQYPKCLRASLDSDLSGHAKKGPAAFAKKHGHCVVMVGRFPDGLRYLWADAGIVSFGACATSLVRVSMADLLAAGQFASASFAAPGAAAADARVVACAPPLSGEQAFLLAELAWKESQNSTRWVVTQLDALSAASAWTPERVYSSTEPLFRRLSQEAELWADSTKTVVVDPPTSGLSYHLVDAPLDDLEPVLTSALKRRAWSKTSVGYTPIPKPDEELVNNLAALIRLARTNKYDDLVTRIQTIVHRHPLTILAATNPVFCAAGGDQAEVRKFARRALERIVAEEFVCTRPRFEKRTEAGLDSSGEASPRGAIDSAFVFTLKDANTWTESFRPGVSARGIVPWWHTPWAGPLFPPERAEKNLDLYVGGYLKKLDLSKSFVTGSAAMSAALRTKFCAKFSTHAEYLASYFPCVYTTADKPADLARAIRARRRAVRAPNRAVRITRKDGGGGPEARSAGDLWTVQFVRHDSGKTVPNSDAFTFSVRPGSDVDIAVDAQGDEFDQIAKSHYAAVCTVFPDAVLQRIARKRRNPMYRIVAGPKMELSGLTRFREVEIYPATWHDICTHHVGMVRLAFTAAANPEEPARFHLTASCLMSAIDRSSPNYYYFLSRKTTPQEVLLKYACRGYLPHHLPREITRLLLRYAQFLPRWSAGSEDLSWDSFRTWPPAAACRGDYNLFNLPAEMQWMP